MIHELGHGLNLDHNRGMVDDKDSSGKSLMGSGNHTYGKSDTYLTSADAAVLSVNPVFSTQIRNDWYADPYFHLLELNRSISNQNVLLHGKFTSGKEVKSIAVYYKKVMKKKTLMIMELSPKEKNM